MKLAIFAAAISITACVVTPFQSAEAQGFSDFGGQVSQIGSAVDTASDWWSGGATLTDVVHTVRTSFPTSTNGYAPSYSYNSAGLLVDTAFAERAAQTAGSVARGADAISGMMNGDDASHVLDAARDIAQRVASTRLKPANCYSMKVPPIDRGW